MRSLCILGMAGMLFGAEPRADVRRLTHSQYNHTVRDLVGDSSRPADLFPQEDFVNGFKNQVATQDVPPLLAEAYNGAAERLARTAFLGGEDSNHLIPCECPERFVREFGLKAFRRPLSNGEVQRYTALLEGEAKRAGKFVAGAQLVVEAMLQSPKFLFRTETGAYGNASRLSYFLWDTMPDAELFRAARAGELDTRDGISKQVKRMLADPRAHDMLDEFTSEWLRFDLVLNAVKDRSVYPQFTPELAAAMTEETSRLIADNVWNGRNFMDIFTARYSFLNSDLAGIYGVPAPATEFAKVSFPENSDRAGIIGQALFLAMTSKPAETSPTVRGLAIREQFLCQQVPDPPPGTNSNLPPQSAERAQNNRDRLKEHLLNNTCAGCHGLMDPIGFGLEKFDAIGKQREKQRIRFEEHHGAKAHQPVTVELDIDNSGSVMGIQNSAFRSPRELGTLLASDPGCQECMVRQLFRYAFGRKEVSSDGPVIKQGVEVFRASQFRFRDLIRYFAEAMN